MLIAAGQETGDTDLSRAFGVAEDTKRRQHRVPSDRSNRIVGSIRCPQPRQFAVSSALRVGG